MNFTLVMDRRRLELLLEALGVTAGAFQRRLEKNLPVDHRPEEFLQLSEELISQTEVGAGRSPPRLRLV